MKTLLLILFFIACWYLASYYLYKREALKQQKPIFFNATHLLGGLLLGGALFVCIVWICFTILEVFRTLYILIPSQYKSLFIILLLFCVYFLIIQIYGTLRTTMHVKIAFFEHLYNSRYSLTSIWLLFLIVTLPVYMHIASGDKPVMSQWDIPATQYEGNNTIFSQILQETANTDAHVRSAKSNIQADIVSQSDRLYKATVTGITMATVLLGLLIIYRTRKPDENK